MSPGQNEEAVMAHYALLFLFISFFSSHSALQFNLNHSLKHNSKHYYYIQRCMYFWMDGKKEKERDTERETQTHTQRFHELTESLLNPSISPILPPRWWAQNQE